MKWYKLTGEKFGKLTVIGISHSLKVKSGTRKYWKCLCECGKETSVVSASLTSGKTKSCGCQRALTNKGQQGHNWKGGQHINDQGYVKEWDKDHSNAHRSGYILKHIQVMSNHLGRPLNKSELVHHINGDKTDNRIENLELWDRSHPPGQRVSDKVDWCIEFLKIHRPEVLHGVRNYGKSQRPTQDDDREDDRL